MIPAEIIDMWDFRLFVRACVEMGQTDEIIKILTEENVIPQGEWIRIDEEKVKCPICEVIHLMYAYPRTTANFCPACGAKLGMGEQK